MLTERLENTLEHTIIGGDDDSINGGVILLRRQRK